MVEKKEYTEISLTREDVDDLIKAYAVRVTDSPAGLAEAMEVTLYPDALQTTKLGGMAAPSTVLARVRW